MAILDDVKISLRITNTSYNTEITDLINACKSDLTISGVYSNDDTDSLIKRAIMLYVKAHFGYNNPDADRLMTSYDMLKRHLAFSKDYSFYQVTFTITDVSDDSIIREATIKLWNDELNYVEYKSTDDAGEAVFNVRVGNNYKYDITATDFVADYHSDTDKNIVDVTGDTAIAVELTGV